MFQSADKDYSKNTCLLLAFFIFYLIFVVNSLGFETSCVKKFIKVQAAGTASKLSDLLDNRLNGINNIAWKGAQMNKLTITKIEADCNCGFRKFVSLTSFKSSFLLFADSVWYIILREHTKNYLFDAN